MARGGARGRAGGSAQARHRHGHPEARHGHLSEARGGHRPGGQKRPRLAAGLPDGLRPAVHDLPAADRRLGRTRSHMVAYAAVSVQRPASRSRRSAPSRSRPTRRCRSTSGWSASPTMTITEANFPTLPKEQVREIVDEIDKAIPDDERVIALDRVLANIDKSQIIPKNVEGMKADPPTIFFSKTPAVLVNLDGEPIWSPIKDNDLKFAVNTNWDLFQHAPTKTYYLRNNDTWLKATDVKGPWTPAGTAARELHEAAGRRQLEGRQGRAARARSSRQDRRRKVFVSLAAGGADPARRASRATCRSQGTEPAVGEQHRERRVPDGQDRRRCTTSSPAAGSRRPTSPARGRSRRRRCPPTSRRSRSSTRARACWRRCPAPTQAAEAVLLAQIPQTARVNKKELKAPEVAYQGEPKFEPIEKTTVAARRQHRQGHHQGRRPVLHVLPGRVVHRQERRPGPWEVAELGARGRSTQIPASSPSHHVTYVTVEDDDDDEWVTFAAAAGYTGMMVAWGCAVWGTRLVLPAVLRLRRLLPVLLPALPDLRLSALVQPVDRRLRPRRRRVWPVRRRRRRRALQPADRHLRARRRGLRSVRRARRRRRPTTRAPAPTPQTRQGSNVYGSWGSTSVQRGDDWASTVAGTPTTGPATTTRVIAEEAAAVTSVAAQRPGGTTAVGRTGAATSTRATTATSTRSRATAGRSTADGNWSDVPQASQAQKDQARSQAEQARGQGAQAGTTRTTQGADRAGTTGASQYGGGSTVGQLDRDSTARTTGTQRTRDAGTVRSGSSGGYGTGSSTYRPSGGSRSGGARAGGGRRR